jgi:hypothetical protein
MPTRCPTVQEFLSRGRALQYRAADLPEDVLALLDHHHLDLDGTYGDPQAGDPI